MILYRYEIWSWYSLLNISGVFYVYNIMRNDKTYHSVFVGSHFLIFEAFLNYYFYGHSEIGLMPNWFMHHFKKSKTSLCHFLFLLIDCNIFKSWILFFWKKPSRFFDQMLGTIISLLVLVSSVLCLQFTWCQGFLDPKL